MIQQPPAGDSSTAPRPDDIVDIPVARDARSIPAPLLSPQPLINIDHTTDTAVTTDAGSNSSSNSSNNSGSPTLAAPQLSSPPAAPLSPLRHHKRTPSYHRQVKETLDAKYINDEIDGRSKHTVNQYEIKDEIGRGSYGAVHLATDQYGHEYAVKEFSKSRLRKRAQSNILKRPGPGMPHARGPGIGLGSYHRKQFSRQEDAEAKDALHLIRAEIAIMKKLNHPNLVALFEVLDDPEDDSLYMVLEMCKKGVIMKIDLGQPASPYSSELCRTWFRDLILGIEYLHSQGIIHRDIKPDNLLLTEDDVLKIVDFGVSEMFAKPHEMITNKSAGSPAFIPPELCQIRHGDVSGKAADVWSMGVTLYCLKYGKLPFHGSTVVDMYQSIREDQFSLPDNEDPDFVDLITRILDKNNHTRITLPIIRNHPWVTKNGQDPLLSEEENCSDVLETPSELEVHHAFTRKMDHLICVLRAIRRFKGLISHSRATTPPVVHGIVPTPQKVKAEVPTNIPSPEPHHEPAEATGQKTVAEEAAELIEQRKAYLRLALPLMPANKERGSGEENRASDTVENSTPFLGIGTGGENELFNTEPTADVVSESPTGIEFDVYERAFETEIKRIRSDRKKGRSWTYVTKHIGAKERNKYVGDDCMIIEAGQPLAVSNRTAESSSTPSEIHSILHEASDKARVLVTDGERGLQRAVGAATETGSKFADFVTSMVKDIRANDGKYATS